MTLSLNALGKSVAALAASLMLAGEALAQQAQTPSITGNSWVAIAIIVALVLLLLFFIRGAIGLSSRDKRDPDDDAGIIGVDDEDDK